MTTISTIFSGQSPVIAISVTSTASSSQLLPAIGGSVRLVNEGPNNCYVSIGPAPQTAVIPSATPLASCIPVMVGEDVSLGIATNGGNQISAVCRASGTATLLVSVAEGM